MNEQTKVQAAYKGAATVYHNTQIGDYQRASARHLLVDIYPQPQPGEVVLDLGCGTGIGLFLLVELFPYLKQAVGLDLSAQMLEAAKEQTPVTDVPVSWLQGNAQHLPFADETFDLIISHNAFHWFPNRLSALLEIKRILKPGGRMAFLFEGAGARGRQLGVRRRVLERHGLTPPPGFGQLGERENLEAWNSVGGVERLIEEAGLKPIDVWVRESYIYQPVPVIMMQFRSTASYWNGGLTEEQVNEILGEMEGELNEMATPRGFREILLPLNVIAQKV